MSVKRYNLLAVEYYDGAICEEIESECGDWILASDYDELRGRVKKMIDAYRNAENCSCQECMKDFDDARRSVEELLCP